MRRTLLVVLLLGCSRKEVTETKREPVQPSPAVSSAAPPLALATHRYVAHFADMSSGTLGECLDLDGEVLPPEDAGADWKPSKDPFAGFDKNLTRLSKPCAEQFKDRAALATCDVNIDREEKGARARVKMRSTHYDYAELSKNDRLMKECLSDLKGEWNAVPRDSATWLRAKHEHARKKLEKATEDLRKAAETE